MTGMPFPACVPELTDGLALLRAHRPEDLDRIVEQSRDAQSLRWTTIPRPYTEKDGGEWLALIEAGWNDERGNRHWAVTSASDPDSAYLGTIDVRPGPGMAAEVGYGLHPAGRGAGLMASALRLVCQWWFGQGGTRMHWQAERGNFASWRVAWSCGFTYHGTVPGSLPAAQGPPVDAWKASLGADDVMEARTPWEDPPVLASAEAGGIRLRPWRDEDVLHLESRDQPAHHMPARGVLDADTFPEWLLVRREFMARGSSMSWCVADERTDAALGEVLVFVKQGTLDDDAAELGYQVLPSARGRGVATAAARVVMHHALRSRGEGGMGLRRLVAGTAEDNLASNTVLDRLGFRIWGHETAADLLPDGRTVDALHWELLRP
ncbi:MAG: GNAT family N-acetyltransferase [Ornithinibacter sp.]